jgi:DNA-binding NarL/FixJ family response regulator
VRPDLLVVDMQLRGMNGADVIMRAREHAPDLPAVIVSGYPVDHPLIARTMALPACRYLGKPVHVQALVRHANVRPDLHVVDMQLRGKNGADVIMRAREHSPDLPAVIVSGYPVDHPLIARTMALPACRYLGKPVHVQALVSLARAARRATQRP